MAAVEGDMNAAEDAWQQQGRRHLAAVLRALLSQVELSAGPADLARVVVPEDLRVALSGWIAQWLDAAYETAWQTMSLELHAAPSEEELGQAHDLPADMRTRHQVRARLIANHLAEAATFEVVTAALAGDSAQVIAARYADALGSKLRSDLVDAAQQMAETIHA